MTTLLAGVPLTVTRNIAAMTTGAGYLSGATVSQFSVAGDVLCWGMGTIVSSVSGVGGSATVSLGTLSAVSALIPTVTCTSAILTAGFAWYDGVGGFAAGALPNEGAGVLIAGGANICITCGPAHLLKGNMNLYIRYVPLSAGATITAL